MLSNNAYSGIKDATNEYSFAEASWLTPSEVTRKLPYSNLSHIKLIYPNELVLDDSRRIIDVLLLAKCQNKKGSGIKLKVRIYLRGGNNINLYGDLMKFNFFSN